MLITTYLSNFLCRGLFHIIIVIYANYQRIITTNIMQMSDIYFSSFFKRVISSSCNLTMY